MKDDLDQNVKALAANWATERAIDPLLVEAIIQQESAGNTHAISHCDAKGLMQLMDTTGLWLMELTNKEKENYRPYEPELNVELGTFYFAMLLKRFGCIKLALAAYNGGQTRLANLLATANEIDLSQNYEAIEWRLPKETRDYVYKVMAGYNERLSRAERMGGE